MGYLKLEDLDVYRGAVKLGDIGWKIYDGLDWKMQKVMGDQFIRATDSVAANIAEGYGRYHYLDRIRFYYNARASLMEAKHWVTLLHRREKIQVSDHHLYLQAAADLHYKINNWISTTYKSKETKISS